jgi:hypothetical protein
VIYGANRNSSAAGSRAPHAIAENHKQAHKFTMRFALSQHRVFALDTKPFRNPACATNPKRAFIGTMNHTGRWMMVRSLLLALLLAGITHAAEKFSAKGKFLVYVGTYTEEGYTQNRASKGIHAFRLMPRAVSSPRCAWQRRVPTRLFWQLIPAGVFFTR